MLTQQVACCTPSGCLLMHLSWGLTAGCWAPRAELGAATHAIGLLGVTRLGVHRMLPSKRSVAAALAACGSFAPLFMRYLVGSYLPSFQQLASSPVRLCAQTAERWQPVAVAAMHHRRQPLGGMGSVLAQGRARCRWRWPPLQHGQRVSSLHSSLPHPHLLPAARQRRLSSGARAFPLLQAAT